MDLEFFAPNYRAKRIFAQNLELAAKKENYLADHTLLLDLIPKVEAPLLSQKRIKDCEDNITLIS